MTGAESLIPAAAAAAIVEAGRWLDARGWCPATAGNISARIGPGRAAITASGRHKGRLAAGDVLAVDLDGRALDATAAASGLRASAETLLHCALYRRYPGCGAVLHGHSVPATVLSRREPGQALRLAGYELLKAFAGVESHDAALDLPLFDNDQDIPRLAALVDRRLDAAPLPLLPAYLIRGHGVYAWGRDMAEAMRHMEALEFLLACELETRRSAS